MANYQMPAKLYMSGPVYAVKLDEPLTRAEKRFTELGVSALVVTDDDGAPLGLISRTDLLRAGRLHAGADRKAAHLTLPKKPVGEIMTPGVISIEPDAPMASVAKKMLEQRVHRLLVKDGDDLIGVVSTKDLMRVIRDKRVTAPLTDCMATPAYTIRAEEPVSLATERLERAKVLGLVVVDESWPVGVFTQIEALESRDRARETHVEEVMDPTLLALDPSTPLHRAAAQAIAMEVRLIVATKALKIEGVLSGLTFARATQ